MSDRPQTSRIETLVFRITVAFILGFIAAKLNHIAEMMGGAG